MKKVTLTCIVLLCVVVVFAGSLSISVSRYASAQRSSRNTVQSTSLTPTANVAGNSVVRAVEPLALTANQLSRRQSYNGPFYSSSRSQNKKYHYPGCFEVANIDTKNLIKFNTVEAACAAGYEPCLRCNPPLCNGAPYSTGLT
jgi:hypothetical protein